MQTYHLLIKRPFLFLVATFLSVLSFAQNSTVKGKITDATNNEPVNGATITLKNTGVSTSTNAAGEFTLMANQGDEIIITNVGYFNKNIKISGSYVQVNLVQNSRQLNEVVVTALGVKKETKRLGYSVQEIKGSELVKAREPNPVNGLTGKIAGLNVGINQEILAAPTVLLRGSPLNFYVVDGIPINSDTWNISPDDIDSYTVLKGPTAAALYGNRGINGAILITTKRGNRNRKGFSVELNSSYQINKGFIAIPKVQNQYGGGDYQTYAFGDYNSNGNTSGVNDADYDVWGPRLDAGLLLPQYDGKYDPTKIYTTTFADGSTFKGNIQPTPWISRGKNNLNNFLQSGILATNNINFSAVTDRSNIRMSVSDGYQRGITPNTGLNTIDLNVLGSYDVSNKFKVEANLNYNRQFTKNIPDVVYGPNSIIYNIDIWTGADWNIKDPNIINYWQPGKEGVQSNFAEYKRYHNPYFMSYEWLRAHHKNDLYGWLAFTYRFNKNIDVMLRSNVTTYNILRTEKEPFSAHPYGDEHNHGNYREDRRDLWENNTELLVRYNKENVANSGFSIGAFLGGSARNMEFTSSYASTDQLIVPNVYTFANTLKPIHAYSFASALISMSAYYSLDLTYKKYFTVSTTGRVDKTSALPVGHNAYFYPSASFSSVLSDFIQMPKTISFLKIRGSYANVKDGGTSPYVGTAFQSLGVGSPVGYGNGYYTPYEGPVYNLATPAYNTFPTYNNQTGAAAPNYTVSSNTKPTSRSNYEYGLDVRLLDNRVGVSGTYFKYKDGPKIYAQSISEASGLKSFITNGGTTQRTGYEISLSGNPVRTKSGFRWDVLANWSTYKEVFTEFAGGLSTVQNGTGYPYHIGDRVDKLFGKVEAMSPDGKVIHDASGLPVYLPKAQYLGHADPDWSWGLNNKFSFKSFSFSFQFDGMVGGKIQDRVLRKLTEGGRGQNTVEGEIGAARLYESNHWGDPGYKGAVDANGLPMLGKNGVQVSNGVKILFDPITGVITNYKDLQFAPNKTAVQWVQDYVSSFYNDPQHTVVNKTYAKLREAVITYSIPAKLLGKSFISKVDLSLVGRNLLYFFPKAFHDIDVDQYPGRDQFGGIRREQDLQTPTTRSFGFNINVVF